MGEFIEGFQMQNPAQTSSRSWGWGVIGTGNIAAKFVDDLQYVADAAKIAVCSRQATSAQVFAERFGFKKAYDNLDTFLANPDLDIVYIATPHTAHIEQALACIHAGKAVLIEKPIAMASSDVAVIQKAAQAKGVFVMEAMWSRFLPAIQRAKTILESGELGKPLRAEVELNYQREYDPNDRLFAPALGGGVLHDLAVYPISVSAYLLGQPSLVDSQWLAAPNGINIRAKFRLSSDGVPVDVNTSFDFMGENCLTIFCDNGVLRIDRQFVRAERLTIWSGPRTSVPKTFPGLLARALYRFGLQGGNKQQFERMGTGLHYQAAAVQAALGQGLLSHPVMPLGESAMALDIIAGILKKPASN